MTSRYLAGSAAVVYSMDCRNRFETPATFRLIQLEWLVALLVSTVLALQHLDAVRWPVFVGLFVVIDLIGYLPGAVAYRHSATGTVPRALYVSYNVMHSLVTGAVIVGVWSLMFGPEWALLAVPIHLLSDRALFGNTMKPFGAPFEPRTHPAFATFERAYAQSAHRPMVEPSGSKQSAGQSTELLRTKVEERS